jgi:hypothetical protein
MPLLLIEGFDHFTSDAHLEDKGWDTNIGGSFIEVGSSFGRFGGNGIAIIQSAVNTYVRKNFGVNKSTI